MAATVEVAAVHFRPFRDISGARARRSCRDP